MKDGSSLCSEWLVEWERATLIEEAKEQAEQDEKLRKKAGDMMNEGMVMPYRRVLERLQKRGGRK